MTTNCVNHATTTSTCSCSTCGDPLCDRCKHEIGGVIYCNAHLPQPGPAPPPPPRPHRKLPEWAKYALDGVIGLSLAGIADRVGNSWLAVSIMLAALTVALSITAKRSLAQMNPRKRMLLGLLAALVISLPAAYGIYQLANPTAVAPPPAAKKGGRKARGDQPPPAPKPDFTRELCADQTSQDFSRAPKETKVIKVVLGKGCFSMVTVPTAWPQWHAEGISPEEDSWVSLWRFGDSEAPKSVKLSSLNEDGLGKQILLQGQGMVRIKSVGEPDKTDQKNEGDDKEEGKDSKVKIVIKEVGPPILMPTSSATAYSEQICNKDMDQVYDLTNKRGKSHFDIKLEEGCFGPKVIIPDDWNYWRHQDSGDKGGWVAFWHDNYSPEKPANLHSDYTLSTRRFRMQGQGVIRIFRMP